MSGADDYSVGYKKPPKHTQFVKGKSGNAKGRPRKWPGAKEPLTAIEKLFEEPGGTIRRGAQRMPIRVDEAMLWAAVERALRGSIDDARQLLERCRALMKKSLQQLGPVSEQDDAAFGGIMVVPQILAPDEWEALATLHQTRLFEETQSDRR